MDGRHLALLWSGLGLGLGLGVGVGLGFGFGLGFCAMDFLRIDGDADELVARGRAAIGLGARGGAADERAWLGSALGLGLGLGLR